MAATNVKVLNEGDKIRKAADCIGTGAIAAGDTLVTDTFKYPVGSRYLDLTNKTVYWRCAATGAIGDWWSEALTQAS